MHVKADNSKIRIGLAQLNAGDNKIENLSAAQKAIRELSDCGAELIVLPEHFDFIGPDTQKPEQAETLEESHCLDVLRELACTLKCHIHIGSFLEKDEDRIYNTAVVFNTSGEMIARYRKIHLFDVEIPGGKKFLESDTISPGSELAVFTIGKFIFGMATCYDLRFPELFRRLVQTGAHVLLLPAAFTLQTGRDHWEILLRARAIENQCWVAAAGQWGAAPPKHLSFGRSMVVNPWGIVVAQAPDGVSNLIAELDLETLEEIRTSFPALKHVRKDIFSL